MEQEQNLLTIKEVSGVAGVSKDTVRRAVKQGVLQGVLHNGKYGQEYKIYKDSLEKWLEDRDGQNNRPLQGVVVEEDTANYGQQGVSYSKNGMHAEGFATLPISIIDRMEQAMHRAGWLEGQLEMTRKMLTEGQETIKQREEKLIKEKMQIEEELKRVQNEKELKLALLEEEKKRLEEETCRVREEVERVKKDHQEEQLKSENERKEKEELMKQLMLNNMPWWKKFFNTKEKLEEEIQKKLRA